MTWWEFLRSWQRVQHLDGCVPAVRDGEVVGILAGRRVELEAIRIDVARRAGVPLDQFDWGYFAGRGVFHALGDDEAVKRVRVLLFERQTCAIPRNEVIRG